MEQETLKSVYQSDDYTDEEFYEEFIKDTQKPLKKKLLSQRMPDGELIARVAKECRYPKQDVQDVLKAFWDVLNVQLEQGREINFGGLFIARLYKPHPRRLYDPQAEQFRMTDPRPKLKLVPTDAYQKYLWKAVHCPVNYFPPERVRNQDNTREQFTQILNEATNRWKEEELRRAERKLNEEKEQVNETTK